MTRRLMKAYHLIESIYLLMIKTAGRWIKLMQSPEDDILSTFQTSMDY